MIYLTDSAAKKVLALLEEDSKESEWEPEGLRISVRSGGCSGFSYEMIFDRFHGEDWQGGCNGVPILVDPQSAPYLIGATLDYKESLMGAGFVWDNPNVTRSCGCGQSFS